METKTDYRVVLTKKMFKSAFFQLLKQKSIQEITIRELCATAGVNRGTFYSHYEDIYHLLHTIEDEAYNQLVATLGATQMYANSDKELYEGLFRFFSTNSDMCTMLISKNSDQAFLDKILLTGLGIFMDYYKGKTKLDDEQLELVYHFLAGGCVQMLKIWFEGGMKQSCDEMADMLRTIITLGTMNCIVDDGFQQ